MSPLSATQNLEQVLELESYLLDDLLTLAYVRPGLVARQLLPSTAYRKSFFVKQAPDLTNYQNILSLVVTSIAATLDRLQLRELLFPIPQYMRLNRAQIADFTDCKVALARNGRKQVVISGFQHRPLLLP